MSAPPPPTNLRVVSFENGTVTLNWTNVECDKILIAWGPGAFDDADVPNQIDLKGAAGELSYKLEGLTPGTSYVFKVEVGNANELDYQEPYSYSPWTSIVWFGGLYVLTYSQKGGRAFVSPILMSPTGLRNGTPSQIGGWEDDWLQVAPFAFNGEPFLLTYRHDGEAFVSPIVAGPNGPQNGAPYRIGGWENDWTQVTTFTFEGQPYVLTYKDSGDAFVAPIVAGPQGPQNGPTTRVGGWEPNIGQITAFTLKGQPYVLIYRDNGDAFASPIIATPQGPHNGDPIPLGGWEPDYTQVTTFQLGDEPYLLVYAQKSGNAFAIPILAGASGLPYAGSPTRLGGWENDWTQVRAFAFS
jgi:hypothetical protein